MEYQARSNTLVTFFLLLILLGGASIAVGLWIHFYVVEDNKVLTTFFDIDSFHEDLYSGIAYARIIVGSISLFVALCAMFCCVRMYRRWQVAVYTLYILFLLAAEIMGIVVPVVYKDSSLDDWEDHFQNGMRYKTTILDVDSIQQKYECCGTEGPDDYTNANLVVPVSCCPNNNCGSATDYYREGCLDPAYAKPVQKELNTMIYIALAFCIVELLALILVLCLARGENSNGYKDMDDSSQRTLRSHHHNSSLDGYGQTGQVQGQTIYVHHIAPNDPVFHHDHMKKYQQRTSAMYHDDGSNRSSGPSAVYQARSARTASNNANYNVNDPNNDVLYYQDHMKRYPSPTSYAEDQMDIPIS